jgi:hypothetical protein
MTPKKNELTVSAILAVVDQWPPWAVYTLIRVFNKPSNELAVSGLDVRVSDRVMTFGKLNLQEDISS